MVFVNISLLAGGLFMALPVILHLLMRPQPKRQVFPAVRFIQSRRIDSSRRLQLQHWVLLALRCGLIFITALALARPAVASALWTGYLQWGLCSLALVVVGFLLAATWVRGAAKSLRIALASIAALLFIAWSWLGYQTFSSGDGAAGGQESPVAAVLILDTSPRMQYRQENRPRLEVAKELAEWALSQLPEDSEVAVLDTRGGSGSFSPDRLSAAKSIQRLRTTGLTRSFPDVMESALELLKRSEKVRKEVYVFTDLSQTAWKVQDVTRFQQKLLEEKELLLYVADCGAKSPTNYSLGDLSLSAQAVGPGAEVRIRTSLNAINTQNKRSVELLLEEPDPTLPILRDGKAILPKQQVRGLLPLEFSQSSSQPVDFSLRGLQPGTYQGQVRIVGEDGLAADDVRYFVIDVLSKVPVLAIAPENIPSDLLYLPEAIAPTGYGAGGFSCEVIKQSELISKKLAGYQAIALIDPQPLTPQQWEKLAEYVREGGGLAIYLGHNAQPVDSFQNATAQQLLGGKLTRQTRAAGELFLDPRTYDHPVMAKFRAEQDKVPWGRFPVYYHWNLGELLPEARVLVPYSNGLPAIVESSLGDGHILTMTTPISDPNYSRTRPVWNELPRGEDAWPCFYLVNDMMHYLARGEEGNINCFSGEVAALGNDPAHFPERYQIFTPTEQPQDIFAREGRIVVRFTDEPGAYRLRGQKQGPIARGFAVNFPAESCDLTRIEDAELTKMFGKKAFQLSQNKEDLSRSIGTQRVGSEFYSWLMALLVLLLALEQLMSGAFYRANDKVAGASAP